MRGGQSYIITLDAAAPKKLDPFLRVLDAAGKELARDDDGGGFPNAKLVFVAPRDDTYKLIVTAYEGVGAYTLWVRASDVKVYEVAKEGLTIEGKLARTDPPLAAVKGAPHQVFMLKLMNGQGYVFDLTSKDFDTFLIIQNSQGKMLAYDDDSGGGLNSRLIFQVPADEVYRVLVSALDKKPGGFQLRVRAGQLSAEQKLSAEAARLTKEAERLYRENRPNEALGLLQKAIIIYESGYGKHPEWHPNLAASLNNMGLVLNSLGQAKEALPYHERALAMREKLYGKIAEGHPQLVASLNSIGALLDSLGHAGKALPYHERALAMCETLYGKHPEGHPQLAGRLNNMGAVLNSLGQAKEALPYRERALAMREKLYGKIPEG